MLTLYQIRGRRAAGVVTTKYTKYTKNGPVAGSVPACFLAQKCNYNSTFLPLGGDRPHFRFRFRQDLQD